MFEDCGIYGWTNSRTAPSQEVISPTHERDLCPRADVRKQQMHDRVGQSRWWNVRNVIGWDRDTERKRGRESRPGQGWPQGKGLIYSQPEPGLWKGHTGHLRWPHPPLSDLHQQAWGRQKKGSNSVCKVRNENIWIVWCCVSTEVWACWTVAALIDVD